MTAPFALKAENPAQGISGALLLKLQHHNALKIPYLIRRYRIPILRLTNLPINHNINRNGK